MELSKEISAWSFIYAHDFLRYFIAAGVAYLIFWVWGRKRWKHKFIQHTFPKAKKLWYEFKYSMSTVLIFSLVGLGIYLSEKAGYTQIYKDIADKGWLYFFFSLMLMIFLHDTYFYWTHRWMHHKVIYKYVHKVHHMSTNPSPWAAYSFHPLEAVIEAGILPLIVFSFPAHPLAIFLFMIYMITRNVLGHLGFEVFPKGFTRNKWFNWHTTSTHHNLHHKYFNCNYGLYFSWWDRWMKTTHHQYDEKFDEVTGRKSDGTAAADRRPPGAEAKLRPTKRCKKH